jgi:hypothetical protein
MELMEIVFLAFTAINLILILANSLGQLVSFLNQHQYTIINIDVEKKIIYLGISFVCYWSLYRFNEGYPETLSWSWIGLLYPSYYYIKKYIIGFKDINKLIEWSTEKKHYRYLTILENPLSEIFLSLSFFSFFIGVSITYHYQIYSLILISIWLIKTMVDLYRFKTFLDYKDMKNFNQKDLNFDNLPKFPLHFYNWILNNDSLISNFYLEKERKKKNITLKNKQLIEKILIIRLLNNKEYKAIAKMFKNYDKNSLLSDKIKKKILRIIQSIENNILFENNDIHKMLEGTPNKTHFYSFNKEDYIIHKNDYKRMTKKEKEFLDQYKMEILKIFDNKCAKTGDSEQIEIDHFFIPKNEGGTFLMQRKNGLKIVNAIPLCKTMNTQKGTKSVKDFFSEEELDKIISKLNILNKKINQELIDE